MPRRDDMLQRALLEAGLKTDPQINALRGLLSDLAGSYGRTRRVNKGNAEGIIAATTQARPEVAGAFDQALRSAEAQRGALGVDPADPQAEAYVRRVGEQKAGALTDLTQRSFRAREGMIYANQAARDEYQGGKAKIFGQQQELLGQKGALAATSLGAQEDKARTAATQRRQQDITARGQTLSHRDRQASIAQREAAAAQRAQDKPKDKSKVKWASPADHRKARSDIERARTYVRTLSPKIKSRAKLIQVLSQGVPAGTDDDGGKLPAIPAFAPDYIRAAMNIELDGSLSRGDLQRLHNGGLQLRRLGYQLRPPQGPRGGTTRGPQGLSGASGR